MYPATESGRSESEAFVIDDYHSFSEPNICLARLQMELCRPQIYLLPAEIKTLHFGVSLKFLVCN